MIWELLILKFIFHYYFFASYIWDLHTVVIIKFHIVYCHLFSGHKKLLHKRGWNVEQCKRHWRKTSNNTFKGVGNWRIPKPILNNWQLIKVLPKNWGMVSYRGNNHFASVKSWHLTSLANYFPRNCCWHGGLFQLNILQS